MMITKTTFGKTAQGQPVELYTLENGGGMRVKISTFGGAIVALVVPDKNGKSTDVALGYDTVDKYEKQDCYFGSLIGRHGNRITKGRFTLNGKEYKLYCNDGENHLHGGKYGFDKKIWDAEQTRDGLLLSYLSADGEEGYPGNLKVQVMYSLSEDHKLSIDYRATCDQDTVCNLTNHNYFNLAGHQSGSILDQYIQIFADSYTVADEQLLPNGEIAAVEGTPMDLRKPVKIGAHIDDDFDQLKHAGGYDHNWVISGYDGSLRKMAYAYDEGTGITLTGFTTLPGVQFYAGNFMADIADGKGGAHYAKRGGFCLESQYFPNAMANSNFLKPILKKDETYHQKTVYQFGTL